MISCMLKPHQAVKVGTNTLEEDYFLEFKVCYLSNDRNLIPRVTLDFYKLFNGPQWQITKLNFELKIPLCQFDHS